MIDDDFWVIFTKQENETRSVFWMKKMKNKSTLCLSIAKQSGSFGTIIHNAGYQALGLDFFYKAFSVNDLQNAI